MSFVLKMVGRELRASWRRLLFFFICVAIGVAAIVTLRSIIQSLRTGLMREARATIASDVLVQSNRPWTPDVRAELEQQLASAPVRGPKRIDRDRHDGARRGRGTRWRGWSSCAGSRPAIRSTARSFCRTARPYSHALLGGRRRARPAGAAHATRRQRRRPDPDRRPSVHHSRRDRSGAGRRVGGFSLGSRVLVDLADLRQTGLLTFGSRANYQLLLKVRADGVDRLTRDVRERLPGSVRLRALVSIDRGSDRREPAAGGELPQPRRIHHRRARRDRRVERDAGVRATEDPERRDPEVHRRIDSDRCWRPTCSRSRCSRSPEA